MELKPSKGLKVHVNAHREAVFGDEGVSVQSIKMNNGNNAGVMTGRTLIGFGEVEMQKMDGKSHWYPIEEMTGEHGEKVVEEEVAVEIPEDDDEDSEEEQA